MLKEICITPQIFDKSQLIDKLLWKDTKSLLEAISLGGYIVGLNNSDWKKIVRVKINEIDNNKVKDLFNTLITILDKRNLIVGHPKDNNISPKTEDEWINIAYKLNSIYKFYSILATKSYNNINTTIEELEYININEKFGITGSKHSIKTEEELEKIFIPILLYAKKVIIIDPYFDIEKPRYKTTLNIIAKFFKNRRGIKDGGTIYINCSSKIYPSSNWKDIINKIYQDYGHIVIINIWERQKDNIKMHDRYIITNQIGIISASGTDKDLYQQSEWAIKDYTTLDDILQQYKENSSPFKLKYIVTSTDIENK